MNFRHFSPRGHVAVGSAVRCAVLLLSLGAALSSPIAVAQGAFSTTQEYYEDASRLAADDDPAGAIIQLKNALQLNPEHLPSMLLLGEQYMNAGRADEAVRVFSDALLLGADPSGALPPLLDAYLQQFAYGELLARIRVEDSPERVHAEIHAARSQALTGLGRINEATIELGKSQAIEPDGYRARLAQVTLDVRSRRFTRAVETAEGLVGKASRDTRAWNSYASALQASGRVSEAIAAYEKAIALSADNLDATIALINIYMAQGSDELAKPLLNSTKERFPFDPRGAYYRALAAARAGERDTELNELGDVVSVLDTLPPELVAGNPQYLMIGALASYGLSSFAAADEYIVRYLEIDNLNLGAIRLRGSVLLALEEPREAIQFLLPNQQRFPNDSQISSQLASAYAMDGDFGRAAETLEQLEARGLIEPATDLRLGLSLVNAGDTNRGIAALEEVARNSPPSPAIDMTLAIAYLRSGQLAKAESSMEAVMGNNPGSREFELLGQILAAQDKAEEAKAAYGSALNADPSNDTARLALARLEIRLQALDAAEDILTGLLAQNEADSSALFELARVASLRGNSEEALRLAERALQISPENTRFATLVVTLLGESGAKDNAEEAARKHSNSNPTDPQALLLYGDTLVKAGKSRKAALVYTQAAQKVQFRVATLYDIAVRQLSLGVLDSAEATLRQGLTINSRHQPTMMLLLQVLMEAGALDAAVTEATTLREVYPESPVAPLVLGEIALQRGSFDQAIEGFQLAGRLGAPTDGALGIYRVHVAKGDWASAEATCIEHLKRFDADLRVRAALTDLLMRQRRWAAAEEELTLILTAVPTSPGHLNNRALARLEQDKLQSALEDAQAAFGLASTVPEINDTLGVALLRTGQANEALQLLREATARDSDNPEFRLHLAQILAALGREKEASAELYRVVNELDASERVISEASLLQASLDEQP